MLPFHKRFSNGESICFIFNSNTRGQSRRGATNNIAEIQGAIVAIQQAARLNIKKLRVVTDSENVYKAVNENIPQWKRNGWRSLYDGQPIEDRSDWEALDYAIRSNPRMVVKFKHVPGHSGIQEHNEADRLAALGAGLH